MQPIQPSHICLWQAQCTFMWEICYIFEVLLVLISIIIVIMYISFEGCDFTNVLSGVWYSGKQKICNADLDLNINILYLIRPQRTLQWAIQVVATGVTWGNFYSIRRCWENKYCKEFHQEQIKKRMTMNTILSMLIDIQLTVCIKL